MYLQRLYTQTLSMAASTERYRSPKRPKANSLSFAFAETGCLAFRARRRSLRCTELQLCAHGEGAGVVVALVERVLCAFGLDLSETG